jgi:hypothetical protein
VRLEEVEVVAAVLTPRPFRSYYGAKYLSVRTLAVGVYFSTAGSAQSTDPSVGRTDGL